MSAAGGPYAAVDLGASSGRVVVGRLVDHAMVTHEVARFENTPTTDDDGVLRWDLAALWRGVRDGLDKAADDGAPASVGIDTWAVDHGPPRRARPAVEHRGAAGRERARRS